MSSNNSVVVLDLGEALTKVGFAGDAHPTHIYRTVLRVPATGALLSLSLSTGACAAAAASTGTGTGTVDAASLTADEWCNVLTALLRRIYFERLLVNPRDRRVLVCDHPLWPRAFRAGLVRALFALDAPAVKMAPALALPIYCTALLPATASAATAATAPASSPVPATSAPASAAAASPATATNAAIAAASSGNGLIVDIGSSESRVLPVCDGFALHELLTCRPCGVRAVVDHFVFLAGRAHLESATDGISAAAASSASASASSSSSESSTSTSSAAADTAAADRLRDLLRLAANSDLGLRGTNSSSSSSSISSSAASSASPFAALTAAEAEDAIARFCFVQSRSSPIGIACTEKSAFFTHDMHQVTRLRNQFAS
jgi:hypothetical protein